MPIRDFYECMIYDSIEPFGGPRGDLQMAILASTIANVSGKRLKHELTPQDFLPNFTNEARHTGQTPEQMHAEFLKVVAAANEKQKRKLQN